MQLFLTSEDDNIVCIACEGEISQSRFPSSEHDPLGELLGESCYQRLVVFDLGQATFIDSSGVGWLLNCNKRFIAAGGGLILHSVPGTVDQVLNLLRLNTILTITANTAAALTAAAAAKRKT
jgi:anti-anti-sigma factor